MIFLCAVFALAGAVAVASPAAEIVPGQVSLSVSSHSIHHGADAHSQIFEGKADLNPNLGINAEVARISDVDGRTYIGNINLQRPIPIRGGNNLHLAGYAGVSWLSVKDVFGEESNDAGLSVGAVADYELRPELNFYSRAAVAFLDDTLWTVDLGFRYELRPRWFLSIGYRGYDVSGSSLGGFLVGATYRTQ